mmetsp:Transcript_4716/g.10996  ORF Transcript_4716/g.10996 Transcript_4716/m.10996 type:complete len:250 (-) Transcript_4716:148-897(-)
MLTGRLDWMLACCSGTSCEKHSLHDFQVHVSPEPHDRKGNIQSDSFEDTFTPRGFSSFNGRSMPMTPRQKDLRDGLELPTLNTYPMPPNCNLDDDEEERKQRLLEMYQEFALDMHTGMYLTQLTSNRDYSDIHCQLMEDMQTLKLDQSNGRIIEFPLTAVAKVYRLVKNGDKWYSAGASPGGSSGSGTEHIVVVEFMRRKLAFVFKELPVSQRFLLCMELLIRRAQQQQAKKALRPLTPSLSLPSVNKA